ncbi:hypothetical protein RYX36_021558 [Vicia faba]
MFVWWRDVLRESTLEGHHTKVVQLGPRYGSISFIVSEVMFLFAFFRASSHSSLAPTVEIGGIWPPKGIGVLDPREIPFLNTPILLSSGAAVTWAHHAILAGKEKRAVYALVATVSLALVFTGFQGMEYYQAPFTISDSIYGSTFFLATGFHGFHVIIGTLFLIICGIRQYLGQMTKEHHVGFEAAAWLLRKAGSCSVFRRESGIRGILLNRRNIPIMSMPIESMLLAVNSNFLVFSVSSEDMMGQSFASLVSTVAAAESAIGLAIFVITFRV